MTNERKPPPDSHVLAPGAWLGMLGGGQLGRMFCHAAQRLGYRVAVLDPAHDSPAGAAADLHILGAYDSPDGLAKLAELCAAVTTEFENVPANSLRQLAATCRVAPSADAVALTQDRITEKSFIASLGISVAPYAAIRSVDELAQVSSKLFPGILKLARLGYDGKGQAVVHDLAQARQAFEQFGSHPCVLEAKLDLACEVSIVVARGLDGRMVTYPLSQNEHRSGILAVSIAPATCLPLVDEAISKTQQSSANVNEQDVAEWGKRIAQGLGYCGVLCVEFFVLRDGQLVVNEIAPRPHNSGHYTIDASMASQFDQQARAMAGLPLGSTQTLAPSVMLNILGDVWFDAAGTEREPNWPAVVAVPGARLHLYGKREARRGRKMGHITCLGGTMEEAHQVASQVGAILGIPVRPLHDSASGNDGIAALKP